MSLRGHSTATQAPMGLRRFLTLRRGSTRLAFPAELVRGVFEAGEPAVTAASGPGEPNGAAIKDLEGRFDGLLSKGNSLPAAKTVLLGYGRAYWSLCVDQVEGMQDVEARALSPLPPHFRGAERRWFQAVLAVGDRLALVVDGSWLMEGSGSGRPEILPAANGGGVREQDAEETH